MKRIGLAALMLVLAFCSHAGGAGDGFERFQASFKNFITCELTRTDARDHFQGKPFKITMIRLHTVKPESGMTILTGAVQCDVAGRYVTLFPALGVETLVDRDTVSYYTIRTEPFSILASELIRFPYQERCPWTRYWVDLD